MNWPADYHMHTPLCRHATGAPTEYAARAAALGLTEIGFSDHAPMPQDDFDTWRMRLDQLDTYVALVRRAARDHPQLRIRLALEVDYLPGQEPWIRSLAARHPWDYLIGSVHYLSDHWAIDDPGRIAEWHRHDPADIWNQYVERLAQAAATRLFDIIGHADLPKKFGCRPPGDSAALFEPFLRSAEVAGVAVELNTAGLRKECREIYPAPALAQALFHRGIPITFGSDAHAVEEVGAHFAEAVDLARRCAYTERCEFSQRRRVMVPLGKP